MVEPPQWVEKIDLASDEYLHADARTCGIKGTFGNRSIVRQSGFLEA